MTTVESIFSSISEQELSIEDVRVLMSLLRAKQAEAQKQPDTVIQTRVNTLQRIIKSVTKDDAAKRKVQFVESMQEQGISGKQQMTVTSRYGIDYVMTVTVKKVSKKSKKPAKKDANGRPVKKETIKTPMDQCYELQEEIKTEQKKKRASKKKALVPEPEPIIEDDVSSEGSIYYCETDEIDEIAQPQGEIEPAWMAEAREMVNQHPVMQMKTVAKIRAERGEPVPSVAALNETIHTELVEETEDVVDDDDDSDYGYEDDEQEVAVIQETQAAVAGPVFAQFTVSVDATLEETSENLRQIIRDVKDENGECFIEIHYQQPTEEQAQQQKIKYAVSDLSEACISTQRAFTKNSVSGIIKGKLRSSCERVYHLKDLLDHDQIREVMTSLSRMGVIQTLNSINSTGLALPMREWV